MIGRRTLSSGDRDYRMLYSDLKRRALEYTKKADSKFALQKERYDKLAEKYEKELESYKLDYSQREVILAVDNDKLKAKIEEMSEETAVLKENYEGIIVEKDALLAEKIAEIKALEERLKNISPSKISFARGEDEELFKTKPRKSKGNPVEPLKCQFANCENANEDNLVKCNACGTWVCESCNEIPIPKLKQVMNKCKTVYFVCKACDEKMHQTTAADSHPTSNSDPESNSTSNRNAELISSLKTVLEDKVNEIESKLGDLIESKLKERLPKAESGMKEVEPAYAAKVLKVPDEVRKIIQDAKNNDKVEESEQEKRAKNFVIHGADEYGDTPEKVKKLDTDYVIEILTHLGITQKPESVTRLGNPTDTKKRPMKVVMKMKEDKEKVMKNLGRLRGTIDYFGKISVTEDYTQSEREQLRKWSDDAKKKSASDPKFDYKVRGDPKNGLKLLQVVKK